MAAATIDGQYLVGYTWSEPGQTLMSNCGYPCIHTGPGAAVDLAPGQTHRWQGRIYFIENDMNELLRRYQRDQAAWRQQRGADH